MRRIDHLDQITEPFKNAVLTIGNFDGVHIGHQALFYEVIEKAYTLDGTSIAMTFEPHPLRLLRENNRPPLITLLEQKVELIERSGVEVLICVPFTREFAAVPAETFVKEVLVGRIGMKAIVVGEDYAFGRNRQGDIALLRSLAPRLGYEVIVTRMVRTERGVSERISSTAIRDLVREGKVAHACRMLGRRYQLRGTVVPGRDRGGRLLGVPTANIALDDELVPKIGIYAVTVEIGGEILPGVANIGYSPTFDDRQFTVEVHILDFGRVIYGEKIRVNFVRRLRDEMKFEGIEALRRQIETDIEAARRVLSAGSAAIAC
jgi:riboflavin kinase / FMN adenylyltransferase